MVPDSFIEFYYGKYKVVDLHNLTKEEARAELVYALEGADTNLDSLVIVHGYHHGTVIKKFVQKEFNHSKIAKKVPLDAARTIFLLKF